MRFFNKNTISGGRLETASRQAPFLSHIQKHRHLSVWLMIWVAFALTSSRHMDMLAAFTLSTTTIIPMLTLCLIMRYWLMPRLLHRMRTHYYILSFLLIALLTSIAVPSDKFVMEAFIHFDLVSHERAHIIEQYQQETRNAFLHLKWTFLLLTTFAVTTISWLLEERNTLEQKAKEQHMQSELKYLRSQINPHFLFNSLNCIYALTLTNDEKAPDSVLRLSEMLRYVIDDCSQDFVPIQKEVRYIENYIDFHRIRMEHEADICCEIDMANPSYPIPPMLLQPIIENSFKHSRVIDHPDAFIHIELTQNATGLTFKVGNSKPDTSFHAKDNERVGIGLQNVKQRLEMLFGTRHTFEVKESDSEFCVTLKIKE